MQAKNANHLGDIPIALREAGATSTPICTPTRWAAVFTMQEQNVTGSRLSENGSNVDKWVVCVYIVSI